MAATDRKRYDVFLSYRREDTAGFAVALLEKLKMSFPQRTFLDSDSIKVGEDIAQTIDDALRSCALVVALIGPDWHVDRHGNELLKQRRDWVRLELSTSIKHKLKILPVFVQGTKRPPDRFLPAQLRR